MQARTALIAAILSGALAVGIVAADVAWSLEASIQSRVDGEWQTIATSHPEEGYWREPFPGGACYGPDFRVVVHNDRPISATTDVEVTYHNATSKRSETLLRHTVSLEAFGRETYDLVVPAAAFPETSTDRTEPWELSVQVEARIGPHVLWATLCKEASG